VKSKWLASTALAVVLMATSASASPLLKDLVAPSVERVKCVKVCAVWQNNNSVNPSKNFHGVTTNGQIQLLPTRHCVAWAMTCDGTSR
jgi:hypothetical protein